ncbi:MAG: CRISPR-associated endonuclease Cas1, partial [Oscillospiraceae bacterium]
MKKLLNTVYVLTPDRYLALDGENLVIRSNEGGENRVPLHNICEIITFGSSGASPALMGKCAEYGISLVFLSRSGK